VFLRPQILTYMINKLLILISLIFAMSSCMVVKGYEKVNLNDPDMALKDRKSQKYSGKFHSYNTSCIVDTEEERNKIFKFFEEHEAVEMVI